MQAQQPQTPTQGGQQMSGIAALAAAAAATQKITTTTASATPAVSGIKVVTPTIMTPSGVKVTPVPGKGIQLRQSTPGKLELCSIN